MLLRLRRVLQAADTINPFDANLRVRGWCFWSYLAWGDRLNCYFGGDERKNIHACIYSKTLYSAPFALFCFNIYFSLFQNSLYLSLASSDSPGGCGINGDKDSLTPSVIELSQENIDLRRQVCFSVFLNLVVLPSLWSASIFQPGCCFDKGSVLVEERPKRNQNNCNASEACNTYSLSKHLLHVVQM